MAGRDRTETRPVPAGAPAAGAGMSVEPVGRWVSPITSELITASSISLGAPQLAPNGEYIYWVEGRPTEKGRQVLCRQCAPAAASLTLLSCLLALASCAGWASARGGPALLQQMTSISSP